MKLNSLMVKGMMFLFISIIFYSPQLKVQSGSTIHGKVTGENGKAMGGIRITIKPGH